MALRDKKIKKIFEKSDRNSKYFITSSKVNKISSSFADAEHLSQSGWFEDEPNQAVLYQLQLIEEDIDELRRHTTSSLDDFSCQHLTASGNISASGGILADTYKSEGVNVAFYLSSNTTMYYGDVTKRNWFLGTSNNFPSGVSTSHITASGNISSSGNFIGSNIGSIYDNYIYLTPTDFDHLTDKSSVLVAGEIENNGGYLADNNARGEYHAQKIIPKGYKATHVLISGSSASDNYRVYSSSYDVGTTAIVGASTAVGTEKAITGVIGGSGTYVSIEWASRGNTDVYGGYIKLVKN